MTKPLSVVRSAVLLSLGLHVAVGWWLLQRAEHLHMSATQPAIDQRRLQVTLVPQVIPPELPTPASTPRLERQRKTEPPQAQAAQTSRLAAQRPAVTPATPVFDSTIQRPPPFPAAADPSQAAGQVDQPKLELRLGAAAQAIERQRRQSPLASAVDTQQMQTGSAKIASAFSRLNPISSNIVEETITADGGRVIRFSGGGCMRMPNLSARNHDDVRKPVMENC